MAASSPEKKPFASVSLLLPVNPSDAVQVGDGRFGSGSSAGERVADLARSGDSAADQPVSETLSAKSIGKDTNAKFSMDDGKEADAQARNKDHRTELRVFRPDASGGEPRRPSSNLEKKSPNQPPIPTGGVICDFYAKGWCIKGSSCRFLHVKGCVKNAQPQAKRDVPAVCKNANSHEGLIEHGAGSGLPNPLKRDEMLSLPNKDSGNELKRPHMSNNDFGDHVSLAYRDSSLYKDRFPPVNAFSSSHKYGNPFSLSRSMEEVAGFQSSPLHSYRIQSLVRNSSTPGSSLSATTWTGSSRPFNFPSVGLTHLDSIPSSLLNSSSRFPGSKLDSLPSTKRKISSINWEPSIPFQPSFSIRSMLSLPESMYDPLYDSTESPKVGDTSFKPSFYGRGSSFEKISFHQNETVSDTQRLAHNDDTLSVSSHNKLHGIDMQVNGVEVVGTSSGRDYNKTMRKQENPLGLFSFKDTEATSDIRHQHQNQGLRNNVVTRKDIAEQNVNKESRELRHLRAALIELVKEILKPKWRGGLLSKVAHNKIVKKAVEKVLINLPVELVPTSTEAIQQYLTFSRGKIDKLVEGYAEIYGKLEALA